MSELLKKIKNVLRHRTVIKTIQGRLASAGIDIRLVYWTKEECKDVPLPEFRDNLDNYSFEFFGPQEMKTIIATVQKGETLDTWLSWLKEGKKCFGAKHNGTVVAFCWIFFKYQDRGKKFRLQDDEVFLFYLYTIDEYRGKNIAPLIHVKLYKILKEMGRNACYSWTDFFNPPAKNFKRKLNAKFVKLVLYIDLFKKYHRSWIIKDYKLKDAYSSKKT